MFIMSGFVFCDVTWVSSLYQKWRVKFPIGGGRGSDPSKCVGKRALEDQITTVILQPDKLLKCDWLRPVVFKPNLKYLHVKITPVT